MTESKPFFDVAVGILINQQGEILLAQRPSDKSWSGWWEFPGGKIEVEESAYDALVRELKEELDITVTTATPWVSFVYEYPKTKVRLAFFLVTAWQGTPKGAENQELAWTAIDQAHELGDLLPASEPPLQWLQLPPYYAITPDFSPSTTTEELNNYLDKLIAKGVTLLQFRQPSWPEGAASKSLKDIFQTFLAGCQERGLKVLINSAHPQSWWALADGVQLRAQDAVLLDERPIPKDKLLAISTHHMADILYAHILEADFVVLGHVLETTSHPDEAPLGWEQFTTLAKEAGRPVYAIGGLAPSDLDKARAQGAHGIAAIRAFSDKG